MPEVGSFGFDAKLAEMGIGKEGRLLRRFVFDEVVSVLADEHLEVDDDGAHWLCTPDGRKEQLKGHWERINEPIED
jgi:hypothetical protein